MIESSDNTSYGNNEAVSPNANTQDESSDDSISATVELDGEDKVAGVNGNA